MTTDHLTDILSHRWADRNHIDPWDTLDELAGWPYDEHDNPPVITDADIDFAAELAELDDFATHQRSERDW
jgi:hypothetical protein